MIPARAITEKKLLLEPRPVKSLRRKSYPTHFAADTDAQAPALAALYNRHAEATQNLGCLRIHTRSLLCLLPHWVGGLVFRRFLQLYCLHRVQRVFV